MARLLVRLPAFAADYPAAMSVMRHMGGLVAMHGPIGCLGNYSGFSEPNYFLDPGMIYCSEMAENETILGLDNIFIDKVVHTTGKMHPPFVAVIGTPVPAVVGTDYSSICQEVESRTGVPAVYVDTTGFNDYAWGIERAYAALDRFVDKDAEAEEGLVNIVGYNVSDFLDDEDLGILEKHLEAEGMRINCVVGECTLDQLSGMRRAERNIVVSTGGLKFARNLEKRLGMPYSIELPIGDSRGPAPHVDAKALIIGDQVMSNALRDYVEGRYGCHCDVATFFTFNRGIAREGDAKVLDEFGLYPVLERGYDYCIADPLFGGLLPEGTKLIGVPHPAVSSRIHWYDHIGLFGKGMLDLLDRTFAKARGCTEYGRHIR